MSLQTTAENFQAIEVEYFLSIYLSIFHDIFLVAVFIGCQSIKPSRDHLKLPFSALTDDEIKRG